MTRYIQTATRSLTRLPAAATLCCLLALCCLTLPPLTHAQHRLELTELPDRAAIGQWLDIASTEDDSLVPGELLGHDRDAPDSPVNWQKNPSNGIAVGLSSKTWWLRLPVHNAGPGEFRILELSRATLGSIGLYSRQPDGRWDWRETGAQSLIPRGDIEAPGYAFKVWLPTGNSEHLIRLRSSHSLRTPILLSSENATLRHAQNSAGWYGAALGLLFGMMLTLLLIRPHHVGLRQAVSFAVIQITLILFAMADRGVLGSWWFALPGVQHGILQLSILLLQMSYVWFTLVFLQERKALTEFWHTTLLILLGLQAATLMLSIVVTRHEAIALLAVLPILSALVVTIASIVPMRNGVAGAAPLFWSGIALLLSRLLLALSLTPILPLATEPYQWLLGFHILHSSLLLWALHQRPQETVAAHVSMTSAATAAPAAAPPQPAPRPENVSGELRLPLRVLVVEDNSWVQQVIIGLLRKQGVETLTAVNGIEALLLLEQEPLDLVLMDCDLPELDGLSATQVWRQRERELKRKPLPILAVTAHVSESQRQQALDAGMNDFLAKPVDMRTLRDAMIFWTARPDAQASDKGPRDVT